jgi:hypothetical protein
MNVSTSLIRIFLPASFLGLLFFVSCAQSQSNPNVTTASTVSPNSSVLQRVDNLEYRLNLESTNSEKRYKDFSDVVTLVGSLFGGFIALFTILTFVINFLRDQQQRKDYLTERKFYEERAINTEKRDTKSAEQQINLGNNVLTHSNDILAQQIDNINKLGSVIALVRDTFQLQFNREKAQSNLVEMLNATNKVVEQLQNDFQRKFDDAAQLMLNNFKNYKAMDWPSISDEALNLAARARTKFEGVPAHILEKEKINRPYELAWIFQLMGTSAFYANDIASALSQLKDADDIFNSCPFRPDYGLKHAYTKYFLGLIEKNWQQETGVTRSNLKAAFDYLQKACDLVKEDNKQFLIPITFAEVQSYRDDQRDDANRLIDDILNRFDRIGYESLDNNQRSLFMRTNLLKGNILFKAKDPTCCNWYRNVFERNKTNAYAHLSYAHSLPPNKAQEAGEHWKLGLNYLISSGAVRKRETTTRVMALTWAIVAATKCNDKNSLEGYGNELESASKNLQSIGQRIPLFFSPISKDLLTIEDLKNQLDQYLGQKT